MEMKLNAKKIIEERKIRAWSQQHLADVSAVSLRTIQRVENNGSGSLETVKALASCFELDVTKLFQPEIPLKKNHSKSKIAMLSSMIVAIFSSVLFLVPSTMASDIKIHSDKVTTSKNNDYRVYSNNVEIFLPKTLTYEVLVDSKWETATPEIASGSVRIYLGNSVVFIEKAIITKTEKGTKITTNYAKFTNTD
ncbi:helix-turn-helix transcriptional regulator [Pseudoalteromonas sp. SWN166]|uniref:helix-turn-helix transcriptional regulator n=1 Tax=Pseudoalteromonas sp. SWN166 TaxID=2792061 RepID=UPI0018CE7856|nr:helix-turn-helix transcriptional regulator [Pseudoalteromonas sp. SWN166]MBH0040397.1 helix-turn-helix transcriptional regulator [Pseudoalteromonas sp. SWN166]